MKKLTLLITILLPVCVLYAEPQEVQSVVEITPDKPAEQEESMPLSLPTPPAEIKADVQAVDLTTTTTPEHAEKEIKEEVKVRKTFEEMSLAEKIESLRRKLREKVHKLRAELHAVEGKVTRLKQEVKDLKERLKEERLKEDNNNKDEEEQGE